MTLFCACFTCNLYHYSFSDSFSCILNRQKKTEANTALPKLTASVHIPVFGIHISNNVLVEELEYQWNAIGEH